MKVLVFPGSEVVGGSEINAVELAAALTGRGCSVDVLVRPGKVMELAKNRGVPVVEARFPPRGRPSPLAVRELRRLLTAGAYDLVHAYEGYSSTEAYYATWGLRTRLIGTLYTMDVPPYLPRGFPILAGTADIAADLRAVRPADMVHRLEPPVDTDHNGPDDPSGHAYRHRLGIPPETFVVSMLSRLDPRGKVDALLDALGAVQQLAPEMPVHLLIAGDGPARDRIVRSVAEVNREVGRTVATWLGHVADPRPVLWAAEAVLGMGTSVLRGMACAKPCVVVGERGFVEPVTPDTLPTFLKQGFWGRGDGASGAAPIAAALRRIYLSTETDRRTLSAFGRRTVVEHHGLGKAADRLLGLYALTLATPGRSSKDSAEAFATLGKIAAYKVHHRLPSQRRAEQLALSGHR